jgi:hypothetical protein
MILSINSSGVITTDTTFDETKQLTYLLPPAGSLLFANTNIDGTVGNNFIQTTNTTTLALANTNFTIEFWVNTYYIPAVDFQNYTLFQYKNTTAGLEYFGYEIFLQKFLGTNYLYATINPTGSATSTIYGSTIDTTLLNKWVHIAYVRQNNYLQLYVNGTGIWGTTQYSDSTFTSGNQFTAAQMFIGSGRVTTGGRYNYPGYISNFRFVNGTAVYTSNFTPPTQRLTAISNTALLLTMSNSDTAFVDSSNNNLTLTAPNANVSFSTLYPLSDAVQTANVSERLTNTNYQISGILDETKSPTFISYVPLTSGSLNFYNNGTETSNFFVQSSNTTTLSLNSTQDFTMECWVYLTSLPSINGVQYIMEYIPTSGANTSSYGWGVSISNPSGTAIFQAWSPSSGGQIGTTVNVSTWYHLALVRYNNNLYGAVNGGWGINQSDYRSATSGIILLGGHTTSGFGYTNIYGNVTNFRLVIGTAMYTTFFTKPSYPLTKVTGTAALYSVNNGSTFSDSSVNNLTLTAPNGNVSYDTLSPFTGPIPIYTPVAKRIDQQGNLYVSGYLNEL